MKITVHTDEVESYFKKVYKHYENQEETITKHLSFIDDIHDLLALEDLTVLQFELKEVEVKGNEFLHKKMPHVHDVLLRTKPVHPYEEAIFTIQQFIREQNIPERNRAIREIQPFNRTTKVKKATMDTTATNVNITGLNELYHACGGKNPFTGEKLHVNEWLETVGWSLISVVPPAYFVRSNEKVGKAAIGSFALQQNDFNVDKKGTKLSELATLSTHPFEKKENEREDVTTEKRMRLMEEIKNNLSAVDKPPVKLAKEQIDVENLKD